MKVELLSQSAAEVFLSVANTLSTVPNIERKLRLLADAIQLNTPGDSTSKPQRKRGPVPLKSTVEFNDIEAKIAARALAHHNVR